MKVLVTGAFGNLGQLVVEQLLADGHQLRCCDLDAPQQRRLAKPYQARCEILLGDITDSAQHAALVDDMDAILSVEQFDLAQAMREGMLSPDRRETQTGRRL